MSITKHLNFTKPGCATAGWRRRSVVIVLSATIAIAPLTALADSGGIAKEAGIGAGTGIASLIYTPIKLTYAIGGLIVGGLAWAFSGGDSEVASIVLTPSLRGDYVVTKSQLLGKQEIEFFGRAPNYRPDDDWDAVGEAESVAATPASRW